MSPTPVLNAIPANLTTLVAVNPCGWKGVMVAIPVTSSYVKEAISTPPASPTLTVRVVAPTEVIATSVLLYTGSLVLGYA